MNQNFQGRPHSCFLYLFVYLFRFCFCFRGSEFLAKFGRHLRQRRFYLSRTHKSCSLYVFSKNNYPPRALGFQKNNNLEPLLCVHVRNIFGQAHFLTGPHILQRKRLFFKSTNTEIKYILVHSSQVYNHLTYHVA